MPTFAFSGRTRGGETITGERIGDTVESVTAALRREQIMVTRIAVDRGQGRGGARRRRARGRSTRRTWPCSRASSR